MDRTSKIGTKIIVTRCVCYAQKYAKNAFAAGAPPGPLWGAHSAPPDPSWIWWPLRGGKAKGKKAKGKRMEGTGEKETQGKGGEDGEGKDGSGGKEKGCEGRGLGP